MSMCQIFPPFSSKVSEKKIGWRKDFSDGKSDGIDEMAENWRKMTEKKYSFVSHLQKSLKAKALPLIKGTASVLHGSLKDMYFVKKPFTS